MSLRNQIDPSPTARLRWLGVVFFFSLVGLGCQNAVPPPDAPPDQPGLIFSSVEREAGLGNYRHTTGAVGEKWMPETLGSGGGFIDYNNDGWQDILLVAGGTWTVQDSTISALRLYKNNQDGTFHDVTAESGIAPIVAYGFGVSVADYDNDGDQDVFLTTLETNLLLRNEGGFFTEVGQQANVAGPTTWSTAALFFDADRDGWLDLYVGNYVPWSPQADKWCTSDGTTKDYCTPHQYEGTPGFFYHNNGDGTFTDQTEQVGFVNAPGKTLGVAALDFNSDGWTDVVVANDTERDLLYCNNGDGTFREMGVASGVAFDENGRARAGMGIDTAVMGQAARPTIAVGNFSEEMVGFYQYMGNNLFRDRAPVSQLGAPSFRSLTFGLFFLDADLDADLDLFLSNGHIVKHIERIQASVTYRQPAQLFLQNQNESFDAATTLQGEVFAKQLVGRGAAYADYDRDGDLDVLLMENGGPVHLWRNELNPAAREDLHFLRVSLQGTDSNRDALGARLEAVTKNRRQTRHIHSGSSYLSDSEHATTFGFGETSRLDSLLVYWPSGRMDVFTNISTNQEIRLVEGHTEPEVQTAAPLSHSGTGTQ